MLVEQFEHIVDDDVQVLLGAEALLFQQLHNGGDLPHVRDRRFFEGHAVAFGSVVTHFVGFHSRANRCASAILAGVIFLARLSLKLAASTVPFAPAKLYHICACT